MDTKKLQEKMVVYLDAIGRVIIAEEETERSTENILCVKNPAIIHVEPKNGNISIQFFPVFFKEFLGSKTEGISFSINKGTISIADHMVLDFKLYAQYLQMFYGQQAQAETQNQEQAKVIKLFDE